MWTSKSSRGPTPVRFLCYHDAEYWCLQSGERNSALHNERCILDVLCRTHASRSWGNRPTPPPTGMSDPHELRGRCARATGIPLGLDVHRDRVLGETSHFAACASGPSSVLRARLDLARMKITGHGGAATLDTAAVSSRSTRSPARCRRLATPGPYRIFGRPHGGTGRRHRAGTNERPRNLVSSLQMPKEPAHVCKGSQCASIGGAVVRVLLLERAVTRLLPDGTRPGLELGFRSYDSMALSGVTAIPNPATVHAQEMNGLYERQNDRPVERG